MGVQETFIMIEYKVGNIFDFNGVKKVSPVYILHICNNAGRWGAGFVKSLSAVNKIPEERYRRLCTELGLTRGSETKLPLGISQFVHFPLSDLTVVNMVAQVMGYQNNIPPIRYDALTMCLTTVANHAPQNAVITMPKIGAGLAGGNWSRIADIIEKTLVGRRVIVYELPGEIEFAKREQQR